MIYLWSASDAQQARDVPLAIVLAQICSHVKKDRDFTSRDADTNKVLDTKAVKLVRTLMAAPRPADITERMKISRSTLYNIVRSEA
ncbi:MAG: hypothetical protein WA049_16290 [Ferribacterium limneticum]